MGSYHAKLSPSSAHRWSSCTASPSASEGLPNEGSEAARYGTCGHQIHAECLEFGYEPQEYLGRVMNFYAAGGEDWSDVATPGMVVQYTVTVDQALIDAVATCLKYVTEVHALVGGEMHVEQRVPIGQFTGEYDADGTPAGGTSDVTIISKPVMRVCDVKLGRKKVDAFTWLEYPGEDILTGEMTEGKKRPNLQMACYALGSLEKFGSEGITHVTMTILQPFLDHIDEYTCTVEELREVEAFLRHQAQVTRSNAKTFQPNYENCMFCPARGRCPAQTKAALELVLEGFEDVDHAKPREIKMNQLGSLYAKVPFVRDWCEAVDSLVLAELKAGNPVVNNEGVPYKLVAGKNGNRQWTDESEAEKKLKALRLKTDQIYKRKLVSPTDVEKLATPKRNRKKEIVQEAVIGELQWKRLQALITQKDGKDAPVVVLSTDPRPALSQAADGFEDVTASGVDPDLAEFY